MNIENEICIDTYTRVYNILIKLLNKRKIKDNIGYSLTLNLNKDKTYDITFMFINYSKDFYIQREYAVNVFYSFENDIIIEKILAECLNEVINR